MKQENKVNIVDTPANVFNLLLKKKNNNNTNNHQLFIISML